MDYYAKWRQLKIFVFWDITQCRLVNIYRSLKDPITSIFRAKQFNKTILFTRPFLEKNILKNQYFFPIYPIKT